MATDYDTTPKNLVKVPAEIVIETEYFFKMTGLSEEDNHQYSFTFELSPDVSTTAEGLGVKRWRVVSTAQIALIDLIAKHAKIHKTKIVCQHSQSGCFRVSF